MGQLLDQAYEAFSDEARRRSIDYRHEARDRPVIVSDGDRVLQIVGNLLSNAFRATPDGGRITLELVQTNGTVSVTVGDSGPGISPEKQERLFRPFVSESGGGTGLGLAIAKELSTALGGRIALDSEVGTGLAVRARPAGYLEGATRLRRGAVRRAGRYREGCRARPLGAGRVARDSRSGVARSARDGRSSSASPP